MNYDTVIVGGGSAGCVLANRLSEDPKHSVLLLEAGPAYTDRKSLPPDIADGYAPTFAHDWGYQSEPGVAGYAPIDLARAKVIGGCSATNATFCLRGTPADYDEWSTLGNPGWSFDEVLPFFRRLEKDADFKDKWHGQEGPLPIRRYSSSELAPGQQAFLDSCAAAGFGRVDDHNGAVKAGAGAMPMNTIRRVRQSTALTYLAKARSRPNLKVRSQTIVDCVLFEGKRAVGVRLSGASGRTIFADRVILAAGAYSSPALLLRSGIGPGDHLKHLGIAVLENLAGVGQNLMDHAMLGLDFETLPPKNPNKEVPTFQTVLTAKSSPSVKDFDLHVVPWSISAAEEEDGIRGDLGFLISVVKPRSLGSLRIRSADPKAAPIIDLGYFTHPDDMPRILEAIRIARRLVQTPPLSGLVKKELFPGRDVTKSSDLRAAVLAEINTYNHPVGTCRMGPSSDRTAVVNSQGRVHGVEGLYVVDASIMPVIPSANTNIPTIMVAERCSAWLKK